MNDIRYLSDGCLREIIPYKLCTRRLNLLSGPRFEYVLLDGVRGSFDIFTCCAMEVVREDDCGGSAMLRENLVKSVATK